MNPIALVGRTLTVSNQSPTTVTFTPTYVDTPAARTSGKGGAGVLIDKINISFSCGGTAPGGSYSGTGTAQLVANTARVECEGRPMLKEGDSVKVTCVGTVTPPAPGTPSTLKATATITLTNGVQKNVDVNPI